MNYCKMKATQNNIMYTKQIVSKFCTFDVNIFILCLNVWNNYTIYSL